MSISIKVRLLVAVLVCSFSFAIAAAESPNIVLIVADDMGWKDVGYNGSGIRTPNLDSMATSGVMLERFYAQPTCSPTRASLLTGQAAARLGVRIPIDKNMMKSLPLDVTLLPQYLKVAGYQTWITGKWHLGHAYSDQLPLARGFDYAYGHMLGGIGYWDHLHGGGLDWHRNEVALREEGYTTHLIADDAIRQIRQRDTQRPFFLYLTFTAPHLPNEAPQETIESYADIANVNRRTHAAMVDELDAAIGRVNDTLLEEGIAENTLIWFVSDNGGLNPGASPPGLVKFMDWVTQFVDPPLPWDTAEFVRTNVQDGGSDNGPFRRGKGAIYEGGVRVPSVLSWPGHISTAALTTRITVQDIAPTLLAVAGVQLPANTQFDGVDQWRTISTGEQVETPDYVAVSANVEALYHGRWKLIDNGDDEFELYDLHEDPYEERDLARQMPRQVQLLKARLQSYPRGESIHSDFGFRLFVDPDRFGGGVEDREPWASVVRDR